MAVTACQLLAVAALAALAVSATDAATTVAVLEIGKGGVARRTTSSSSSRTSVQGVASFWSSMHEVDNGNRRRASIAHHGMAVVPDFFNRADGGLALGIMGSGVDLASMPTVAGLLEEGSQAGKMGVVGHFHLAGSQGSSLMEKASKDAQFVDAASLGSVVQNKLKSSFGMKDGQNVLEAMLVKCDNDKAAADADAQLSNMLKSLQKQANDSGSTIVVHLVVEEEEGAARRRLMSRRLEDENNDEDEENENQNEDQNDENEGDNEEEGGEGEDNANGNNNNNANANGNNGGMYGYGYYDENGQWVTNYKTMFQIQYFNLVLWTCVGLTIVLCWTTALMMYMPLIPDTLLFGESAKMMGD